MRGIIVVLLICAGLTWAAVACAEIERIYVITCSHLDIGFTAPPDEVSFGYKDNIDHAMELCESDPDFRWTIETSWQLQQWLRRTSDPEKRKRLAGLIRAGRIELGAFPATFHSGIMGAAEICRVFDMTKRICDALGTPFPVTGIQDDVPGYTSAYPQICAAAGIRYFLTGINRFVGGGTSIPRRELPFYWEGRDGGKVLTWISFGSYSEANNWGLGIWSKAEDQEKLLRARLQEFAKDGYPYDAVLVMASVGDNVDARHARGVINRIRRWNENHDSPRVILSTPSEFFRHMENKYGERFPVLRGDWSGCWELTRAGAPYGNALNRQAHELIPAAETFAAIGSVLWGQSCPAFDRERAWDNCILFDEHSAGGGVGWPKLMTREQVEESNRQTIRFAEIAHDSAEMLLRRCVNGFVDDFKRNRDGVLVLNLLPWERESVVVCPLAQDIASSAFTLYDTMAKEQIEYDVIGPGRIAFIANAPPFGYHFYEIRPAKTKHELTISKGEGSIYNDWWRVGVDDKGKVVQLVELKTNRSLLPAKEKFASVWGGSNASVFLSKPKPLPSMAEVQVRRGKILQEIRIRRAATPVKEISLRLWNSVPRLEVDCVVDQTLLPDVPYDEHSLWYLLQFPFALRTGGLSLRVEGPLGFRRVPQDCLPGAFVRWFASQHCVDLREAGGYGVTVAARETAVWPCSGPEKRKNERIQKPVLFAGLLNHATEGLTRDSGIVSFDEVEPGAPGRLRFHFAIRASRRFDATSAESFGFSFALPLRAMLVRKPWLHGPEWGFVDPSASFLSVRPAKAALAWLRSSERDGEFVLLLHNLRDKKTRFEVHLPAAVASAEFCDLLGRKTGREASVAANVVSVTLADHAVGQLILRLRTPSE